LEQVGVGNLNNGNIVPLTDPRVIPNKRTRTSDEGCAIIGNGFICADLARNVRCVNGKVAVNVANPFNQNNLLKACVGGFCGGSKTLVAGQNPCVATAFQAVQGNAAGNEFFIPPATPPAGRRLRETDAMVRESESAERESEATERELQTFYDGTPTENDLNWEEGFSGDDVTDGLVGVDDKPAESNSSTGAIVGGIVGVVGVLGVAAAFLANRRQKVGNDARQGQMSAHNPMYGN